LIIVKLNMVMNLKIVTG